MADRTSSSRRTKPSDDSVGNFIVDQEIGKGSFAQVYSGRHKVRGTVYSLVSSVRAIASIIPFSSPHKPALFTASFLFLAVELFLPEPSLSDLLRRRSFGRGP